MKLPAFAPVLMAGILISGCAFHRHKTTPPAATPAPAASSVIITPDASPVAKVASYNPTGRFAVLNFPVGQMPAQGQEFFIYRNGLKVAEVRITGPQRDTYVVADLVSGEAQMGDEVRSQ